MFQYIRQQRTKKLEDFYCLLAKLRRSRRLARKSSTILLIPPTEPNSLGDEAMVAASVAKFCELGYSRILCLNYDPNHSWRQRVAAITEDISYGKLFSPNRLFELRNILSKCSDASGVMLIGADCMDGGYGNWHAETKLTLLRLLSKAGIPVVVAGFSFKQNATREACQLFKSLPRGCRFYVRDPYSRERFTISTGLDASPSVDLAFGFRAVQLSNTTATLNAYEDWCTKRKKQGSTIVAFCPNVLLRAYLGHPSKEEYLDHNQQILDLFLNNIPETSLVLIAHDSRVYNRDDRLSDSKFLSLLAENLTSRWGDRIFCFNLAQSAMEVDQVCQTLDFAITGRMHFAIACLRAGKPPVCVEFQDKVSGLMKELFKTSELAVQLSIFSRPNDFANNVIQLYCQREELSNAIHQQLPLVTSMSNSSFETFKAKRVES